MTKNLLLVLIALMLFPVVLPAQNIKPTDVVSINAVTKVKGTKNGTEASINFILKIKKSWHINANKPNDQSLTPTEIKFDSSIDFKIKSITYPPPEMVKLQFSNNELALYEQEAEINVIVDINKNFRKRLLTISGQLQYQPCNDQTCLFPVSKSFNVKVKLK
jgi:DsbC/DsbD-like thiol-disulfide interchange protein